MKIRVQREIFAPDFTLGAMYIDDVLTYFSCEDEIREKKVPNETAIPAGKYKVIIDFSNRFQKLLPHILDVPGFDGIRIHSGNTDDDTSGCLLIGFHRTDNGVSASKLAMEDFMPRLEKALEKDNEVWLEIA